MNKRSRILSIASLLLTMVLMDGLLFGCAQAPSSGPVSDGSKITVTVEIDPSAADGKVDLPSADLTSISQTIELPEGSNAYDALVITGAVLEGSSSYVTSINGLAEKAAGPTYGWLYEVNGESPTVAADACVLHSDDTVRWYYTSWSEG